MPNRTLIVPITIDLIYVRAIDDWIHQSLRVGSYANDNEDMLIGLTLVAWLFVISRKIKNAMGDSLFKSLLVVWAACTIFSQMNILRLQDKILAC